MATVIRLAAGIVVALTGLIACRVGVLITPWIAVAFGLYLVLHAFEGAGSS